MSEFKYQVVKCNDCDKPLHVAREGMPVPRRFIVDCSCGHFYEYDALQIQVMSMGFKPLRELPRESKEGDLERLLDERKHRQRSSVK